MMGSSPEAKCLRQKYTDSGTTALENPEGVEPDWDTVAEVMKSCALATLGPTPRSPFPWPKGKEVELKQLQDTAHKLETLLVTARRARSQDVDDLLAKRREASKSLLAHKRRWEAEWRDDLADAA